MVMSIYLSLGLSIYRQGNIYLSLCLSIQTWLCLSIYLSLYVLSIYRYSDVQKPGYPIQKFICVKTYLGQGEYYLKISAKSVK